MMPDARVIALWVVGLACAIVDLLIVLRSVEIARRSHAMLGRTHGDAAPPEERGNFPFLSIVVPARNEERQIAGCVRTLLALRYPAYEVIVVDDRSDDATAAIVERIARDDARLTLVRGVDLPDGWVGKPWALEQGVRRARGAWLLFTDADTEHEPDSAGAAFAYARASELDAVSLLTEQTMVTAAERIVLPSILWTIALGTGPLDDVNDPARGNALFNGQYILIDRVAYEAIGGHGALRGEIAEDLELARRLKADGRFRTALVGASGQVRTRMYRSFREIWEGFVKNFALGVRGQPLLTAGALLAFALFSPLQPLALLVALAWHVWGVALLLAAGMLAAGVAAARGMRRFGFAGSGAAWLPIGIGVMSAIFATSLFKHARGGVTWRGRRYARS